MTKKHFVLVADAIKNADKVLACNQKDGHFISYREALLYSLGKAFESENPNFDYLKFEQYVNK